MAKMTWDKYALDRIEKEYIEFEHNVNWNKEYMGTTNSTEKGVELLAKYAQACRRKLIRKCEYNSYRKAIEKFFFNI